jgi:hypothetical protein
MSAAARKSSARWRERRPHTLDHRQLPRTALAAPWPHPIRAATSSTS